MIKGLRGLKSEKVKLSGKEFLITEMTMPQAESLADLFAKIEVGSLSEFLETFAKKPQALIKSLRNNNLHREFIFIIISKHGKNTAEDIDWEYLSIRDSLRLVDSFLALNKDWLKEGKKSLRRSMQGLIAILPQLITSSTTLNEPNENIEQNKNSEPGETSRKT